MHAGPGRLLAVSDLHVSHPDNRRLLDTLVPENDDDWLLVAGDVADRSSDVAWALEVLRERFALVVWTPGNHELWRTSRDPVQLQGPERYEHLVEVARSLGVLTPEDPFPVWAGPQGDVVVAPLFLLYDYSFRDARFATKEESLADAYEHGVVCTDEHLLDPGPFDSCASWCADRVAYTRARLDALDAALPTVLVNHYPLVREPTQVLRYPQFAQWCGTTATHDWHVRYRAAAVVYGHLHIPRETVYDGVPFVECSLGYPNEWQARAAAPQLPRQVLPRVATV